MKQHLSLKGRAIAYIDWANVYGWTKTLKREIDAAQLFEYLKTYTEIGDVRLYAGRDTHPKSEEFLRSGEKTGYKIISKPVKYILVTEGEGAENISAQMRFRYGNMYRRAQGPRRKS